MTKFSNVIALTTGIVGLLAAAATASADGYVGRPAAVACCSSWSGYYVGINGGYGFSGDDQTVNINQTFATLPFFNGNFGSLDIAGAFGGLQVGANHQMGKWVLGLEADIQGSDIMDSSSFTFTPYLAPGGTLTVGTRNTVGWFGTLRPRIGAAWGNTLVYATGGLAWGAITHTMQTADNFGFSSSDRKSTLAIGYSVGGGIEHAFSSRLSVKLEYQYIDLGSEHYKAPELFGAAATAFAHNTDTHTDFHTVRVGLNYKFHDRGEAPLK
jgi:outer membrane immunogenic protein